MAKKRSGKRQERKKARSRAAKKAWRTRRARARLPRGHHRGQIGGVYPSGWADAYIKRGKKKGRGRKKGKIRGRRGNPNLVRLPVMHCRKCGRTIFGGSKGMSTHMRHAHGCR